MAKVHNLFYSSDADKQTLHRRITPTQKQIELQQERWNDVCEYLEGDLNEVTGYTISSWLQGSYKYGTQVRPARKRDEFDIDLGIYFNWPGDPNDGEYSPRTLKSFVQNSLIKYKDEADDVLEVVVPTKKRCSRIRFSGDFHIDVPAYHLDADRDARELATESNEWEYSDPKAFYKWFRECFSEENNSQVRRLVRYMKIWASLKLEKAPSSILLTVLIAEAYIGFSDEELDGDDTALNHISESIAGRLRSNPRVFNPVDSNEDLNRLTEEETDVLLEKLYDLTDTASRALAASTEFESASIWSEAFHHFFPAPSQDISELKNYALVPLRFVPEVFVKAVPTNNTYHEYTGNNRVGPIPKECKIFFYLTNSRQLPPGSRIQWIVRNEGEEAEFINDLGHLAGEGPSAEEKSAYKGTHYMDIVVTAYSGEILGFRRIPVEISGFYMPPRNRKKPGYTRFKGRR